MNSRKRWSSLGGSLFIGVPIGLVALSLMSRPAAGKDESVDDVPAGTVAFFLRADNACPQGWRVAAETTGRLIVGAGTSDGVGKQVGTPLSNEEDRTHVHSFSATADLPYKSISALDGWNQQGASAGVYRDVGISEPAPSGLPFFQLVTCVKP